MNSAALVGRADAIASLNAHLAAGGGLLTLHGPPGVGKSALAHAWLATLSVDVWRADVLGAADRAAAVHRVLTSTPLLVAPDARFEDVIERLDQVTAPRVWLIEHVDGRAADLGPFIDTLRCRLPDTLLVLTSRQLLLLRHEAPVDVEPLDVAAARSLFARWAQLTPAAVPTDLVEQLGGLPLAIELVAAHMRYRGAAALRVELPEGLPDVATRHRDQRPRHRSLRIACASAWADLSPEAQRALVHLATLKTAFGRQTACALIGPDADALLDTLCDHAWVHHRLEDDTVRFCVLAPLAAFVRTAAGPAWAEAARRHAEHFTADALQWIDAVGRAGELPVLHARQAELEAAYQRQPHSAVGTRAALLLVRIHYTVGPVQRAMALADAVADDASTDLALRARAWVLRARARFQLGRATPADEADLRRAIAAGQRIGDRALELMAVFVLAVHAFFERRSDTLALLTHAEALADETYAAHCARWRGFHAQWLGDIDAAISHISKAERLFQQTSDIYGLALSRSELARLFILQGEAARAVALIEDATRCAEQLQTPTLTTYVERLRAALAVEIDDDETAWRLLNRVVVSERALGKHLSAIHTTLMMVLIALRTGRAAEAMAGLEAVRQGDADVPPEYRQTLHLLTEMYACQQRSDRDGTQLRLLLDQTRQAFPVLHTGQGALAAVYRTALRQATGVRCAADGSGFVDPAGAWVDLTKRPVLTRVLAALTQAREPLSVLEIFAAGWPDESASHESARARVYMAISTLRRLGLRSHLVRHPESGYQLVPPAHPAAATPSVG